MSFQTAVDELSKWYNDECRECARAVLKEVKENDRDENDVLHEMIDGHAFVIYTFKAQLVVALSDNSGAYQDELGELPPTVEAQAYMAMMADVREYMEAFRDDEDEVK